VAGESAAGATHLPPPQKTLANRVVVRSQKKLAQGVKYMLFLAPGS
jgi:hypothetical protein